MYGIQGAAQQLLFLAQMLRTFVIREALLFIEVAM